MRSVQFQAHTAKLVRNRTVFRYLAVFDAFCGRKDRYTLLALSSDDPLTIGRELRLSDCRRVVADLEALAPSYWEGDRETLVETHDRLCALRKERVQ